MSELLPVSVVQKILGCSKNYVYQLIDEEKLESVNFGIRRMRVCRRSLEDFLIKKMRGKENPGR